MLTLSCSLLVCVCSAEPAKGKDPPVAELAKDESPKPMVQAWVMAAARGDADAVKAGFDVSTDAGGVSAEAAGLAARALRATDALAAAARRKYGEDGVKAVERALHAKLGAPTDWKALQATVDEAKVYLAEDGQSAVVRMPAAYGEATYTEVERKGGRWYVAAKYPRAVARAALGPYFTAGLFEKATEVVEKSRSLDEARVGMEALEKSLGAPAPKTGEDKK
jgi:hypothetical protein